MGTPPFVYGAKWFVSGVCVGMTLLCVVGVCVCGCVRAPRQSQHSLLSEYKYYTQNHLQTIKKRVGGSTHAVQSHAVFCERESRLAPP